MAEAQTKNRSQWKRSKPAERHVESWRRWVESQDWASPPVDLQSEAPRRLYGREFEEATGTFSRGFRGHEGMLPRPFYEAAVEVGLPSAQGRRLLLDPRFLKTRVQTHRGYDAIWGGFVESRESLPEADHIQELETVVRQRKYVTVEQLARELSLSEDVVLSLIEQNNERFRAPFGRSRSQVLAMSDLPISMRERLDLLRVFLSKRPG